MFVLASKVDYSDLINRVATRAGINVTGLELKFQSGKDTNWDADDQEGQKLWLITCKDNKERLMTIAD